MTSIFKVDTEGNCIFCRNPNCQKTSTNGNEIRTESKMGFKMLLRYLKVDIKELVNLGEDSNCDNINFGLTLCDKCAPMTQEFFHTFLEYERILLQLDECASKLKNAIVEGEEEEEKNVKRVLSLRRRLNRKSVKDGRNAEVAEELRRKIVEKCKCSGSNKADCTSPKRMMRTSTPSSKTMMSPGAGIIKTKPEGVVIGDNSNFTDSTGFNDARETTTTKSVGPPVTMESEQTRWKCAHCGKSFTAQTARRRHILTAHPMLEFSNKMPPGITETHLENSLLALLSKTRKTRARVNMKGMKSQCRLMVDCPFCKLQLVRSDALRIHVLRLHWNKVIENIIQPPDENVQVPIKGVDPSWKPVVKYQCNLCGHCFPSSQSLGDHHTSKHGQNPDLCIYCGKECRRGSLSRHVKISHPFHGFSHQIPEGVGIFEQTFNAVLTEIEAKSPTTLCPISNSLMYECYFCGLGLRSNLDVKMHLLRGHMKEIIEKCVEEEKSSSAVSVRSSVDTVKLGECGQQASGTGGVQGENVIALKNSTAVFSLDLDPHFSEESSHFMEIPIPMEMENEIGNEEFEIEQKPFVPVNDPLGI